MDQNGARHPDHHTSRRAPARVPRGSRTGERRPRPFGGPRASASIAALLLVIAGAASADAPVDVTDIDLDDLLEVQVSSPSKKDQPFADVPSAITVLRGEDLVRMGVTTLAEALRAVPGVQVARVSAHSWAISARGFNDTFSNKLLVLIDGRSVYSPIHSGVFWDVQDVMIEDIDRIEVIRGPGGSLWGANAINGVINVITKRASETRGAYVSAGVGSEERRFGDLRYGFGTGGTGDARVYARYAHHDDALRGDDPDRRARDGWFLGSAGFRGDWSPEGSRDRISIDASVYDGQEKEEVVAASLRSPTGTQTLRDRSRRPRRPRPAAMGPRDRLRIEPVPAGVLRPHLPGHGVLQGRHQDRRPRFPAPVPSAAGP